MMHKIIEKNERIAQIGMKIIIFMMLFVVGNNLMVIHANALVFNNFSGGTNTSGSVNTANGYFDSDSSFYGYTGNRNVYVATEAYGSFVFEPITRSAGISGTIQTIHSPTGTLLDAVVSNGYLYFTEGTTVSATLYKKKTRADTSMCESTDTGATGCIQTIDTNVGGVLRTFNGILYYTSTTSLKHVDSLGNAVLDFTIQAPYQGSSQHMGMAVFQNSTNNSLEVYLSGKDGSLNPSLYRCTAAGCAKIIAFGAVDTLFSTYYATANTIYVYTRLNPAPTIYQKTYFLNGTSIASTLLSTTYAHNNRAYVGSMSTIGLYADSGTYSTFNSNEVGFDALPVVPSVWTYDIDEINSYYSTYYNHSSFKILASIQFNPLSIANLLANRDTQDFRWETDIVDPNGVQTTTHQSSACVEGLLTCTSIESLEYPAPSNGWLQGTWKAKLYEVDITTNSRALLATSPNWQVLNTSTENQSIIPIPIVPPTSGTGSTAINTIDGWTALFGLGINTVSKFLFAMVIIILAMVIGFVLGKSSGGSAFAGAVLVGTLPYLFFAFIEYIPSWSVIVLGIIVAIQIKLFR